MKDMEDVKSINMEAGEPEGNHFKLEFTDDDDDVGKPTEVSEETGGNTEVGMPDENYSGDPQFNHHENEELLVAETSAKDYTSDTSEDNNSLIVKIEETTDVFREPEANINNTSKKRPCKVMRPPKNCVAKTRESLANCEAMIKTEVTEALGEAKSTLNAAGSKRRIKDTKMSHPSRPKRKTQLQTPVHDGLKDGTSDFECDNRTDGENFTSHEDESNQPGGFGNCEPATEEEDGSLTDKGDTNKFGEFSNCEPATEEVDASLTDNAEANKLGEFSNCEPATVEEDGSLTDKGEANKLGGFANCEPATEEEDGSITDNGDTNKLGEFSNCEPANEEVDDSLTDNAEANKLGEFSNFEPATVEEDGSLTDKGDANKLGEVSNCEPATEEVDASLTDKGEANKLGSPDLPSPEAIDDGSGKAPSPPFLDTRLLPPPHQEAQLPDDPNQSRLRCLPCLPVTAQPLPPDTLGAVPPPLAGALKGGTSKCESDDRAADGRTSHKDVLNKPGGFRNCEPATEKMDGWPTGRNEASALLSSLCFSRSAYSYLKTIFLFLPFFSSIECAPTPPQWKRLSFQSKSDLTNDHLSIRRGLVDICDLRPPHSGQMFQCTEDSFFVLTNEYVVDLYTCELNTDGLSMEYGQSVNRISIHPLNIVPLPIDVVNTIRDIYRRTEAPTAATVDPVPSDASRGVVGREGSKRQRELLCAVLVPCIILSFICLCLWKTQSKCLWRSMKKTSTNAASITSLTQKMIDGENTDGVENQNNADIEDMDLHVAEKQNKINGHIAEIL